MSRISLRLLIVVAISLAAWTSTPGIENYDIDPEHTFVTFKVNRFSMVNVVGFFPDASGHIALDLDDMTHTSAEIIIRTPSVFTGHSDGRDEAVKSAFFLDVENHPTITFKTSRVEVDGKQYTAVGDLTIKGITHEVHFPFAVKPPFKDPTGLTTIAISGKLTVDRLDYQIFQMDKKLANGEPFIGREVEIELNALAVKAE